MKSLVSKQAERFVRERKIYRRWLAVALILALLVTSGTFTALRRTGRAEDSGGGAASQNGGAPEDEAVLETEAETGTEEETASETEEEAETESSGEDGPGREEESKTQEDLGTESALATEEGTEESVTEEATAEETAESSEEETSTEEEKAVYAQVTGDSVRASVGGTVDLTGDENFASLTEEQKKNGSWSSSDGEVAEVSEGIVECMAVGTAEITFVYPAGGEEEEETASADRGSAAEEEVGSVTGGVSAKNAGGSAESEEGSGTAGEGAYTGTGDSAAAVTAGDTGSEEAGGVITWEIQVFLKRGTFSEENITLEVAWKTEGTANKTYGLLDEDSNVTITVKKDGEAWEEWENEGVKIKVTSVTRYDVTAGEEINVGENEWKEGEATLTTLQNYGAIYNITYVAYCIEEDGEEKELASTVAQFVVNSNVGSGGALDGDWAYIEGVGKPEIKTGTEPFDSDDEPGNDSSADNTVIRTYDTATYSMSLKLTVRKGAPYKSYKDGKLYFELVLPVGKDQAQFEPSSMGWLCAADEKEYKIIEGENRTILKGWVLMVGTEDDPYISEKTRSLTVVLRILDMKNEGELKPSFTFWLEGNDVTDSEDGIVTDSGCACETHEDEEHKWDGDTGDEHKGIEYVTRTADPITVSARPSYRVAVVNSGASVTQKLGVYDFSSGNSLAPNKMEEGEKTSVYGRLGAYGVIVQIVPLSGNTTLRGVELPDEDTPIELDLTVASTYSGAIKKENVVDSNTPYTPMIWSVEGDSKAATQQDERDIPATNKYATSVPFNTWDQGSKDDGSYPMENRKKTIYNACYNGGTWTVVKESEDEITKNTVHVRISGFKVDLTKVPYSTNSSGTWLNTEYFNPATREKYWEVSGGTGSTAVKNGLTISSGEIWVVQPFYPDDKWGTESFKEGVTIASVMGVGSFSVKLTATGEEENNGEGWMKSITGQTASTSTSNAVQTYQVLNPGTISQQIAYVKYNHVAYNDALTENCWNNGDDWIQLGSSLEIESYLTQDSAEADSVGVAYDVLVKFDGEFFEPEKDNADSITDSWVSSGKVKGEDITVSKFYAAKRDGKNWEDDTELKYATTEDLYYYSNLKALEADGKVCVGVLLQYRGAVSEAMNHLHAYVKGYCKTTAEAGEVYMISPYARAWSKDDVKTALAANLEKETVTDEDYTPANIKEIIPVVSGKGDTVKKLDDESTSLPTPFWKNGGKDGGDSTGSTSTRGVSDIIRNYTKPKYENGVLVKQESNSGTHYADSCVVIGYLTNISAKVAQKGSSGDVKSGYDVGANQRVVDYELNSTIARNEKVDFDSAAAGQTVGVTVTVEIPKGLTYIEGSAYIGGTYTEYEGASATKQGTVTGGIQFTEGGVTAIKVTNNIDGTQTLTLTFETKLVDEVDIALPVIHLSCDIGDIDNPENDVSNNENLVLTAKIRCDGEGRPYSVNNNNLSTATIQVIKETASSLGITADQDAVLAGTDMGFTLRVTNSAKESSMNLVTAVTMPKNGDGLSKYSGNAVVKLFRLENPEVLAEEYKIYYTTEEYYTSSDLSGYTDDNFQAEGSEWVEWTPAAGGSTSGVELESGEDTVIKTIVIVGVLKPSSVLKMHLTVSLPDGAPGDAIKTTLSNKDSGTGLLLSSEASSTIVSLRLSGLVWLDTNANGIREDGEKLFTGIEGESGITVNLTGTQSTDSSSGDGTESGNGTENDKKVYSGTVSLGNTTNDSGKTQTPLGDDTSETADGLRNYEFTGLVNADFQVVFTGDVLDSYLVSPVDQLYDDTVDSDADPETKTIAGIDLTDLSKAIRRTDGTAVSLHHDMGLYQVGQLRIKKVVEDPDEQVPQNSDALYSFQIHFEMEGKDLVEALEFPYEVYTVGEDGTAKLVSPGDGESQEIHNNGVIQLKAGQYAVVSDIPVGTEYTVTETTVGNFTVEYEYKTGKNGIAENEDGKNGTGTISESGEEDYVTVTNTFFLYTLPSTGGMGIYWHVAAGAMLMMAAGWYGLRRRKMAGAR